MNREKDECNQPIYKVMYTLKSTQQQQQEYAKNE